MERKYPPIVQSTLVLALIAAAWLGLRMALFRESVFPLTYVLPLMLCVWSRRRWHLWAMTGLFIAGTVVKLFWVIPDTFDTPSENWLLVGATAANILIGAVVVHLLMAMRDNLELRSERISNQNAELEAQTEELTQQNEEIKSQTEELAQQNEEIESQAEELERQNEELQETNSRLSSRESMLHTILESARTPGGGKRVLDDVCRRALEILGVPAEALAVLEIDGEALRLRADARLESQPPLRERWPLDGSLARVVLQEDRTAFVDDLHERRDLAAPFTVEETVRSLLVTPLRVGGERAGVIVACSRVVAHWTHEQFRLMEWVAAQCGLIVEGLRWQEALKVRAREIEEANRAKDQFLAMLSHELRTPLTPVLAAAESLRVDPRLPEDVRDDAMLILRNASVQSRLIDDLLDLTRVGQGKLELHRQVVPIVDVIRDAAAIVAGELDARDQTLTMEFDLPNGASVDCDSARLQQVFWNLLKNAVKFSPYKGRINLSASIVSAGGTPRVKVAVIDEGVGIAADDMKRIFLPFEQAINARLDSSKGLGLGLAIAKAVVELHGGSIAARSSGVGRGATFTIELPLAPVATPASADPSSAVEEAATETSPGPRLPIKILLVEDHEDTGRIIARLLRGDGYAVEHATTVADALQLFTTQPFDLLVSDLGLPDGSGLDMMKTLIERRPGVNGICMSGYGMEADIEASRAAGFVEHLTKPVDMRQLQSAIARVARSKAAIS